MPYMLLVGIIAILLILVVFLASKWLDDQLTIAELEAKVDELETARQWNYRHG